MSFVYVLRLMGNRYYIGKSKNIINRLITHFNGRGSQWTRLYQPVEVIEVYKNCNGFDEDYFTKQYMEKYGIENVRGGSYSNINLTAVEIDILKKEFDTALDRCFICSATNHQAVDCPNSGNMNGLSNQAKYNLRPRPKPKLKPRYLPPVLEENPNQKTRETPKFIPVKIPPRSDKLIYDLDESRGYLLPNPEENISDSTDNQKDLFTIDSKPDYSLLNQPFGEIEVDPYILGQKYDGKKNKHGRGGRGGHGNSKRHTNMHKYYEEKYDGRARYFSHNHNHISNPMKTHMKTHMKHGGKRRKYRGKKAENYDSRAHHRKGSAYEKASHIAAKQSTDEMKESIELKLNQVMKKRSEYEKVDHCSVCFDIGHKQDDCPIYKSNNKSGSSS